MAELPTPAEAEAAMLRGFRGEDGAELPDGMEDVPAGRVECPSCGHEFDSPTNLVPAGPRARRPPTRVTE